MSTRERRRKASDVFNNANYLFADKVPFEDAFPTVEELRVEILEEGEGVGRYYRSDSERSSVYTHENLGEFVNCSNPRCYNGGVRIGKFLRPAVEEGRAEFEGTALCQGYEGSPKGRRKYRDCLNYFTVKGQITYKTEVQAKRNHPTQSES